MQNEFEKQVREKMEELDLVPSAPVWDKIEMQIRKKKDRRRLVLWIPLAFLILSGGIWWMIADRKVPGNAVTVHQPGSTSEFKESIDENTSGSPQVSKEESSNQTLIFKEENLHDNLLQEESQSIAILYPGKPVKIKTREQSNKKSFPSNFTEHHNINKENSVIAQNKVEESLEVTHNETTKVSDNEKLTDIYSGISGTASKNISTDSFLMKDSLDEVQPALVDVLKKLKKSNKKLQLGISLAGGIAGEGSGIRLKSINNFDMTAGIPPLTNISDESSATNSNLHFGAGMKIRKNISERFAIVSGLGYDFYSSKRLMGTYVSTPSATSGGVTYDEFFLNYGQELNEIKSKYHFISLPLLLEWKANKKIPVFVQAGFSVQQLIASDAWQFDKHTKVYFNDHNRLEKTQLFANLNLGYEFKFANHPLVVGPSMQYGFTRINTSENKRLFSLGLSAQFYLK